MHLKRGFACFSPSLPASCSCILSISMGVVTMTWHMPAPQPASISLNTVSPFLLRVRHVLNKPPLKIINTYCPFPRRSSHRVCLPVFGKVVPEEVIGSQLDCLLRGNQGQIYSSTWGEKIVSTEDRIQFSIQHMYKNIPRHYHYNIRM